MVTSRHPSHGTLRCASRRAAPLARAPAPLHSHAPRVRAVRVARTPLLWCSQFQPQNMGRRAVLERAVAYPPKQMTPPARGTRLVKRFADKPHCARKLGTGFLGENLVHLIARSHIGERLARPILGRPWPWKIHTTGSLCKLTRSSHRRLRSESAPASAQTLPVSLKKDATKRHKTTRTRKGSLAASSLNVVYLLTVTRVGKSGLRGFLIRRLQVRFLPGLPDCPQKSPVRAIPLAAIRT